MLVFASYLLKVIICSGILFGYYRFMLRNKIFHQYNRFYLLAAIVLSLALPLIQINIWHNESGPAPQSIKLLQVVGGSNEYLDEIVIIARRNNFTTERAILLFYSITSFLFLTIFIQALIKIRILFIKHRHSLVENIFFVNTTAKGTPFSFLKYIFWNDHIDPESPAGHQIFKHELAHVRQKHSYDKLFINATLIFFWCNPFFWLIQKELNMIHEFIADKIAVEDSGTEALAAMILQAAYPRHRFSLINPFFYSPIKRRLLMLTKNKNPKVGYIGRILALPLAVLVFAAFTLKAKTFKTNFNPVYNGKKITVVIDAGHGGSDNGALSLDGRMKEKDLALDIIKKIKALNSNANINIVLTRETDVFQSVKEKAIFTKAQNADLFISIHLDATPNDSADVKTGMGIWVAKDNYANAYNSKLFASAIINEFANNYELPVNNLPQQSKVGIWVLQESPCPSVIIEAGYITNKKDLAYLKTDEAKEKIAKNVLAAVERWAVAKENGETGINNLPSTFNKNIQAGTKADTFPIITLKNHEKALIILDGKTISNDELKKVNPENIESVNVLKEKTEIALYGDKGKNGVVIIATKGKEIVFNDIKITVEGDSNINNATISGKIKINGLNLDKLPIIVIDGKLQSSKMDVNSIPPNNIESINVLKGKTALDKYGSKAINGAIEITTKAKSGKNQIPISGLINDNRNAVQQDNKIFTQVENEPRFPGGDTAWRNYLIKNVRANLPVLEGWKTGNYKIVVQFIVKKDGTIVDIKTNDYAGSKTSEHCMDLIRKGPKWEPAIQDGQAVNAFRKQPFTFIVDNK